MGRTHGVGSTLDPSKPLTSIYEDGKWYTSRKVKVKERYVATEVTSVDAAAFLEAQLAASAFVAIKIDVEGYEYTLLPWLYQHNASLLCRLNLVVIEWHERMMPAHRGETNRLTRLMESPSCRLPVVPWH